MALPVANIAPRNPSFWSSPNICANLPMFFTASSPKSSPSATLILSAASTNSNTSFFPVIPKRPASPARAFSFSRAVRVSISLNSSFSPLTSSRVIPVYLITCASASSISAYSSTHLRAVKATPVRAPTTPAPIAAYLLTPSAILEREKRVSRACTSTSLIRCLVSR